MDVRNWIFVFFFDRQKLVFRDAKKGGAPNAPPFALLTL